MTSFVEALGQVSVFLIMGESLTGSNTLKLDFSPSNADLEIIDLSDTKIFDDYVFGQLKEAHKKFGIGGYFEHRAIYKRSNVFATAEADFRNVHLGVDIWAASGTPIFCPLDGKVHSFQDNVGFGNYGPTVILEHQSEGTVFYTLYGHLTKSDLIGLKKGQRINAGEIFCHLGPFPENGDWPPHLHFQVMNDLEGNEGDFPGVCSVREIEKYKKICPDPDLILRMKF